MRNKIYLIAGIIVLVTVLVLTINGCFDKKKIIQQITKDVKHVNDTTVHWRDQYNTEHAQNLALQEGLQTAQIVHAKELADVTTRLNVKDKQIENLQHVVATIKGTFIVTVDTSRRGDTTASAVHVDPFTDFTTTTIGDQETVTYNVRVPIHLVQYWKRPHSILGVHYGDPVNYIDGFSNNPNVTLDSLSNVQIIGKKPGRWGVGPYVGLGYDGNQWRGSVGIGIHYDLFRW